MQCEATFTGAKFWSLESLHIMTFSTEMVFKTVPLVGVGNVSSTMEML